MLEDNCPGDAQAQARVVGHLPSVGHIYWERLSLTWTYLVVIPMEGKWYSKYRRFVTDAENYTFYAQLLSSSSTLVNVCIINAKEQS